MGYKSVMIFPLYLTKKKYKSTYGDWFNKFAEQYEKQRISSHVKGTKNNLKQPVVLLVHGYGASPYECKEIKDYLELHSTALVVNIYLGAHKTLSEFSASTWQDWLKPIQEEYHQWINQGYEHIILVGCSTGATLLLQGLIMKLFLPSTALKHVVMIDPLVKLKSKYLDYFNIISSFLYDPKVCLTQEESPHWLPIRPKSTLMQLQRLIKKTLQDLKTGVGFASHINITIFYSTKDPTIDTQSALHIHNGITKKTPTKVKVIKMYSRLHVFTRLLGRKNITKLDKNNQLCVCEYIKNRVNEFS